MTLNELDRIIPISAGYLGYLQILELFCHIGSISLAAHALPIRIKTVSKMYHNIDNHSIHTRNIDQLPTESQKTPFNYIINCSSEEIMSKRRQCYFHDKDLFKIKETM